VAWYADRYRLVDRLLGAKAFQVNGQWRTIHVRDVLPVPQPIGAFFCAILDKDGQLTNDELAKGRVAVIDVGMYTSDYALSDGLSFIEKGSGSITDAMSTVYTLVGREIKQEFGLDLTLHGIDEACRTGQVRVYGKSINVARLLNRSLVQVWESVKAKAGELWGDARDIDAVIGAGGGMVYFGDWLGAMYPHVIRANGTDVAMTNADGFYKYAVRKFAA